MVRFLQVLSIAALVSLGILLLPLSLHRQSHLSELEDEALRLSTEVYTTRTLVDRLEGELEFSQERLAQLEREVSLLRSATRCELHDPTYEEVTRFLMADQTNTIPYNKENFVCLDYAATVKNHAGERGLRCALVIVRLSGSYHAIVAFRIKDLDRLCYFEPQLDVEARLQVGRHYGGECAPNTAVSSDDIVENWELYW